MELLIPRCSVNGLSMFEQRSLPLSVTNFFETLNLTIKCSSMGSSSAIEPLDAIGVVIRELRYLIVSM